MPATRVPDWGALAPLAITGSGRLSDNVAVFPTASGPLLVSLTGYGLRLQAGEPAARDYGMLVDVPEPLASELVPTEEGSELRAGDWRLAISHTPFAFALYCREQLVQRSSTDGHFTRRYRLPPLARRESDWLVALDLGTDMAVYGLGEQWTRLDRRGHFVRGYNEDALGVNAEHSYKNMPFAWSPAGWGVFTHTPWPVDHSVGFAPWSHRSYVIRAEGPGLDLFIMAGTDGRDLIDRFTALTGRSATPPMWSLGVILSKAYYRTPEELLSVARKVRARGMPCEILTIDGRAWQDTDTRFVFDFDPERYQDPAAVLSELKALDFKICLWEYPLVSLTGPLFEELAAKGWLLKAQATGEAYRYLWPQEAFGRILTMLPPSGMIDFTHPDAYAWWRDAHAPLFAMGADMLKPDFGEQIPDDAVAHNGATGRELHNIYSMLYNRCCHEAAQLYGKTGGFLFSRSAWVGSQRYPSQWGGDPQADWEGLAASLRGALSWGLSGGPFYATDIGGFYADQRDATLYVRWAQAAVFGAHFRLHGIGAREPWSYGPEAEAAAMAALKLRHQLVPYLWRTVKQAAATGLPVMRAMALAFPNDRTAWAFDSQFMCGDDLLIAPCLNPDGDVTVYLPKGTWHRFPSGGAVAGGQLCHLTLALDEMAVFARAGAEIPLGPAVEHGFGVDGPPVVERRWTAL